MSRVCFCSYSANNTRVRNNLSMTPAQVFQMYEKGMPVSLSQLSNDSFIDQKDDADYNVPLEYKRGTDLNVCFENRENVKELLRRSKLQFKTID